MTALSAARAAGAEPLVRAENVVKEFRAGSGGLLSRRAGKVHAVSGVSFELAPGETLGLVGESGCGKSTLARCVTRLHDLTSGRIVFGGSDISGLSRRELRPYRRQMQMVFQDPYGSLNPRRRVGSIIGDPFAIHGAQAGADQSRQVQELMELVGLNPEHYNRFPADFSGGQRQRIGLARALALRPQLLVCDEPVSALDVSIQAQILNLLADLQDQLGLTYLFIAHDLSVVRRVSDRIAVMYLGRIVELADAEELHARPRHPYTQTLLDAEPVADPDEMVARPPVQVRGEPPSPVHPPAGCAFHPRCPRAQERCRTEAPDLSVQDGDRPAHLAACHFPLVIDDSSARTRGPAAQLGSPAAAQAGNPAGAPAAAQAGETTAAPGTGQAGGT